MLVFVAMTGSSSCGKRKFVATHDFWFDPSRIETERVALA